MGKKSKQIGWYWMSKWYKPHRKPVDASIGHQRMDGSSSTPATEPILADALSLPQRTLGRPYHRAAFHHHEPADGYAFATVDPQRPRTRSKVP
jgi:hypothetical protein